MPRVIVKRDNEKLEEASGSCPIGCLKKVGNEYVIDPSQCIDCGVCQSVVDEGVIVEDGEASDEDKKYNEEKSQQ